MSRLLSINERAKQIATYQFGDVFSKTLFSKNISVKKSKIGKIRYLYLDGKHLATLGAKTGKYTLSSKLIKEIFQGKEEELPFTVIISEDIEDFFEPGKTVFCKHIIEANRDIRPGDEVFILDSKRKIICVGRTYLSGKELNEFKFGVAIKTRK